MVVKHTVEGYEEYLKLLKELEEKKAKVYILFTGSLNNQGVSWCPDCVQAEPAIEEVVNKLPDTVVFVKVLVGNREFWKDKECPFRKDKKVHLSSLPTIVKWNNPERLEGNDFANKEIIEMAFEEDL
ncbi:thioredoxin domain-containing protein 17-like [Homalodisca vitripennis]|uniref:Thioredoxin domain-containing protein 17 n=1 Tax=Homalodisca liturata TaxID=320908 RepID=A0A1B6J1D0_9HEMI|nr:thioredoxin domain-containing protein 17-like [Homalodisca vitripennis]